MLRETSDAALTPSCDFIEARLSQLEVPSGYFTDDRVGDVYLYDMMVTRKEESYQTLIQHNL